MGTYIEKCSIKKHDQSAEDITMIENPRHYTGSDFNLRREKELQWVIKQNKWIENQLQETIKTLRERHKIAKEKDIETIRLKGEFSKLKQEKEDQPHLSRNIMREIELEREVDQNEILEYKLERVREALKEKDKTIEEIEKENTRLREELSKIKQQK
jgi:hypothetical protein